MFHSAQQHNRVIALLATLVVVLLAQPGEERDPGGARSGVLSRSLRLPPRARGFARDLNSDLDLDRLGERLVTRVTETLLVDRMVLLLGDENATDFEPIRTAGFTIPPPGLSRRSGVGGRLEAGHTVAIDDPLTARRFTEDEIAFWRDWGLYYFLPCVSKEGTIAVLGLGRKESAEPLNSEDLALLTAVAGQVATALENGRLYRQLQTKADELARLREFNENIIESLDDGLVVLDLDDRVVRWNRALEQLYGVHACGGRGPAVRGGLRSSLRGGALRRTPGSPGRVRRSTACRCTPRRRRRDAARERSDRAALHAHRARHPHHRARSSSSRTSAPACSSKSSCRCQRRWRRSGCSPPVWLTR